MSLRLIALLCAAGLLAGAGKVIPLANASPAANKFVYLPAVMKSGCDPIPGASYNSIVPTFSGPDPSTDNRINLGLRGYEPVSQFKGLVGGGPANDPLAPQFPTLFGDLRTPVFGNVYALYRGDLSGLITSPPVTLAGLATTPGEIIRLPDSGYDIGGGFDAMVLYADETRIAMKYTPTDDIAGGYTVYLEKMCVEPSLLALYEQLNAGGRSQLPA
jgi:hypothetical protein